jgi:nucleoid DNA-binding protein
MGRRDRGAMGGLIFEKGWRSPVVWRVGLPMVGPTASVNLIDDAVRLWHKKASQTGVGIRDLNGNQSISCKEKSMNKAQLVDVVQKELGKEFSKAAAERSLDAVLRSIRRGVQTGGSVQIVGFGTFRVSKRAARMGRNPKTGESIQIKASKTVRFSAGQGLKESL